MDDNKIKPIEKYYTFNGELYIKVDDYLDKLKEITDKIESIKNKLW